MAVFRNKKIRIPGGTGITKWRTTDRRVTYTPPISNHGNGGGKRKPIIIGYACGDSRTEMYPNDNFKRLYPVEWEKLFGEKPQPTILKPGTYALLKAINTKSGILDFMDSAFGKHSSPMKDYIMHAIIYHSFVTAHIVEDMHDYVLFSGEQTPSDSSYSTLFSKQITRKMILEFKVKWINWCKNNGVEEVYLCCDGSNNPCESKALDFNEKGHAKILKNKDIVSFTYAVSTNGIPVTYELYRGGMVDSKALMRTIKFLTECELKIKGVILDRGYCDSTVMAFLDKHHIEYLIMVKGKPTGIQRVREEGVAGQIRFRADYWVPGTQMFAAQQDVQLYSSYKKIDHMTTFFDHQNGSGELETLLKKLNGEVIRVEKRIEAGKDVTIKKEYRKYLDIEEAKIVVKHQALQEVIDDKGIYSIIHSERYTPRQVNDLYDARDVCETLFMILKTQIGFYITRVYLNMSVHSKFLLAFISTIVQYFIRKACEGTGKDTNGMIRDINLVEMERVNSMFVLKDSVNTRQKTLLKNLNEDETIFDRIVKEINDRKNGIIPQSRRNKPGRKKGTHVSYSDDNGTVIRRKPGLKPGTKRSDINKDGSPRKKPGPKPGVKRGDVNADGSQRKKPGPKPGSHHKK